MTNESNDSSDGSASLELASPPDGASALGPPQDVTRRLMAGGPAKGSVPPRPRPPDTDRGNPAEEIHEKSASVDMGEADTGRPPPHPGPQHPTYADAVMNGTAEPANFAAQQSTGNPTRGGSAPLAQNQGPSMPPPPVNGRPPALGPTVAVPTVNPSGQTGGESSSEGMGNPSASNNGMTSRMSVASDSRAMSVDSRSHTPGAMSLSEEDFAIREVLLDGDDPTNEGGGTGGALPAIKAGDGRPNPLEQIPEAAAPIDRHPPPSSSIGRAATEAHEREQSNPSTQELRMRTPSSSPHNGSSSWSRDFLRSPEHAMERLSYILGRGSLVMINFSQRNLGHQDAELIRSAILSNPQLSVLKLGYNNLGNVGANLIASAIQCGGERDGRELDGSERTEEEKKAHSQQQLLSRQGKTLPDGSPQHRHHPSLSVLDLGFNNIGDEGCASLAARAVARNPTLTTLYLSGNAVREAGALALAEVIAGGCGLTSLHLTANRIGPKGVKGLMRSMTEFDVTMQMAQQDRENRMALEEEREKRKQSEMEHEKESNNAAGDDVGDDVDLESLGINDDGEGAPATGESAKANDEPDELSRLHGFKCMQELYLGGTHMESTGCLSVSNMLLTNLSLRVLCLSDNGLNDQDLSLFSQSLSRNRELPLEVLQLSFNKLTCAGVETLMNAIWGSRTLREIKLDNNQIRDRGAQLAAVVLTSVDLTSLDMGFNRLTIVGIKALMKSLAENRSLHALTLSGNVLDTNASKAVSYALAYNKTIRKLYVDHCSLSYAAQRHIAAGIVSNSNLALRVMSGFPLGGKCLPISVTLGLPAAMETWSNEQVLKFIRVMWDRYRHENEAAAMATSTHESMRSMSTAASAGGSSVKSSTSGKSGKSEEQEKAEPKAGPSDPATVVAAAKSAFEALGDAGGALLLTEEPQRSISDSSPMVSSDAVMLEKTESGTIRVPSLNDDSSDEESPARIQQPILSLDISINSHVSTGSLCTTNGKDCPETPCDPMARRRNMEWLRLHFRSLNEMTQLPYAYADLIQLYRYFYSPVDGTGDEDGSVGTHDSMPPPALPPQLAPGFNPGVSQMRPKLAGGLQRKISYRGLNDVMMLQGNDNLPSPNFSAENTSKRRQTSDQAAQPATKRARNGKPRIDYFPRIKAKLDQFLSSSKQTKALILLRQLKFVETTMFHGGSPYSGASSSNSASSGDHVAADAERVLIDLL
ncbi:hypothetical protein ACHAXT_000253 [Thalassiosira profunda]